MTNDPNTSHPVGWGEGGRLLRFLAVVGGLAAVAVVLGLLSTIAEVPRGRSIVWLQLAGTTDRAKRWMSPVDAADYVSVPEIHHALLGGLLLIAFCVVALFVLTHYLGPRGFRIAPLRAAARSMRWVPVVAGILYLVVGLVTWICTDNAGSSSAWLDPMWAGIAAAMWGTFVLLFGSVAYVAAAAAGYVVTPPWVREQLLHPEPANVVVDPAAAMDPEAMMVEGTPTRGSATPAPASPAAGGFGIAVAGGGIRSAAMALGGLQELDRDPGGPNWTTAEKVTSVSGGSYIAGAFSLARSSKPAGAPSSCAPGDTAQTAPADEWPPHPPGPCPDAWTEGAPENDWLTGHLGYLLAANPTGEAQHKGSDVPGVASTLVLGLIFNIVLLLIPLWLVVQPLAWLLKSNLIACDGYDDPECLTTKTVWPTSIWIGLALVAILLWVSAGWIRGSFTPGTLPFRASNWVYLHLRVAVLGVIGLAVILAVLLLLLPALVKATPGWLESASHWARSAAFLSAVGAIAAAATTLARPLSRFAAPIAGVLFIATMVLLAAYWASTANLQHWDSDRLRQVLDASGDGHDWWNRWLFQGWSLIGAIPNHTWLLVLIGWLVAYSLLNPEWWSMAPFYRGKLRNAFATYRRNGTVQAFGSGNVPTGTAEPSLYELDKRAAGGLSGGSPLQICATATITGRSIRTHYGIPALSVTFDPTTVRLNIPSNDEGGWTAYQCATSKFERLLYRRGGSRFTTMMAVGISGAALSPAMGKFKIGPARTLLAMLNIRLGVWVPNPRYVAAWRPGESETAQRPYGPGRVPYPQPRLGYLIKEAFGVHDPDDLYLYVTDGGHWENTGLVELLRDRNFSEVVCLDADAGDRDTVTQLANAVILAELECGVKISVDLDPLRSALRARRGDDYAKRSVTVGLIRRGDRRGLLWYAKPALTVSTPPDVLSYGENDPDFPTTSTVDQFFHTAKFSAYRDLGRFNGRQVIEARAAVRNALESAPTWADFNRLADGPPPPASPPHWAVVTLRGLLTGEYEYQQLRSQLSAAAARRTG